MRYNDGSAPGDSKYKPDRTNQFQMPYGPAGHGSLSMVVNDGGILSNPIQIQVLAAQPQYPRARGRATQFHSHFSYIAPSSPAFHGEQSIVSCTGLGTVSPPVEAGFARLVEHSEEARWKHCRFAISMEESLVPAAPMPISVVLEVTIGGRVSTSCVQRTRAWVRRPLSSECHCAQQRTKRKYPANRERSRRLFSASNIGDPVIYQAA